MRDLSPSLRMAQGLEDYFSGRSEASDRWVGAGCSGIGVSGRVDRDGFLRAMHGCDPGRASDSAPSAGEHKP